MTQDNKSMKKKDKESLKPNIDNYLSDKESDIQGLGRVLINNSTLIDNDFLKNISKEKISSLKNQYVYIDKLINIY